MARTIYGLPGIYNASGLSLSDGEGAAVALDVNGNQLVNLASPLPGSDPANDIQYIAPKWDFLTISTAATTTVWSGEVLIGGIEILGGTLGAITGYDNTSASGNTFLPAFTPTSTVPCNPIAEGVHCLTGITIVTAAATIILVKYLPL